MKKRRQQVSDSDTSSEKKSNVFQNQFFQDMFQDIKEIDVEPEELSLEEDSYLEEDSPLEEEPIFKDLSKLSNEDGNKKNKPISKHDFKKQIAVNFFKNPNDLKRGIIMKEILDKPRALRKNII
ncbi:MAG: hypothetical protein ACJZ1P_08110 [Candidatus Neomarinimicrobiota bacterium]